MSLEVNKIKKNILLLLLCFQLFGQANGLNQGNEIASIPEWYQKYFEDASVELFTMDTIFIYKVNNASEKCPGFDHPMVLAQAENCVG